MRISVPLLTLAGTVAGTAAAVVAYQSAASVDAPSTAPASVSTPAPVQTTTWLPCGHGWKVKGNVCVRIKEKVVVVADLPAPAAPRASVATTLSASHNSARPKRHHAGSDANEAGSGDTNEVEDPSDSSTEPAGEPDHEDVGSDD